MAKRKRRKVRKSRRKSSTGGKTLKKSLDQAIRTIRRAKKSL